MQAAKLIPDQSSAADTPLVARRRELGARPIAACLLLVVITLGVYWSVTTHGFVDYDDGDYVTANPQVQRGLTWAGVKWAFTTGHASNWHPLTWLSHLLDVSLFGHRAGGPHLTSLLLHGTNVARVFLLLHSLMLVPVIGLVQVGIQSMADRYTYLPLLGVFIALVWGAGARVARWPKLRSVFAVAAAITLGGCAVLTAMQVRIWASSEALFRHVVRVTANNYLAFNKLGFYLSAQSMVFMAGASALMVGNDLTTLNQPVEKDLQMLKDLGLDPSWDNHGFSDQVEGDGGCSDGECAPEALAADEFSICDLRLTNGLVESGRL